MPEHLSSVDLFHPWQTVTTCDRLWNRAVGTKMLPRKMLKKTHFQGPISLNQKFLFLKNLGTHASMFLGTKHSEKN